MEAAAASRVPDTHPKFPTRLASSALAPHRKQAETTKVAVSRALILGHAAASAAAARIMLLAPEPRWPRLLLLLVAACTIGFVAGGAGGSGTCDFSVERGGELYSFALAAPTPAHRHGVRSEDGFYKVTVNDSILWFQLCDEMIFNFDSPACLNCEDCGGPLRCGTGCSALVSKNIGGYDVCTTIGRAPESQICLIDDSEPQKGVVVKMFSSKCSISVFVYCDSTIVQVSDKFTLSGNCHYATTLRHPSGCARFASAPGNGWGWLGTLFITILCLLGGYFFIGAIYRYYFLGIHSIEAIPNLEFWISLPQILKCNYKASYTKDIRLTANDRSPPTPRKRREESMWDS